MKITIRFKHFPREHKYQVWTGQKTKYMVGTVHTRNFRLPKFLWERL